MIDDVSLSTGAPGLADLVARARTLAVADQRHILAIAGAPGAGKSTLAAAVLGGLPPGAAAIVPQDGFHLSDEVLAELGLTSRKGAPETFDGHGLHALLTRLRRNAEPVIYAPIFHRDLEAAVAGSIPVSHETPLVIVEGNYLLLDQEPWAANRDLFDETWHLEIADSTRRSRLIQRHERFGKSPTDAKRWALSSDERNAVLVQQSSATADLIVRLDSLEM